MIKERRRHARLRLPLEAHFRLAEGDEWREATIETLGAGGAALICDEELATGTRLAGLRFALGPAGSFQPARFEMEAKVVQITRQEHASRPDSFVLGLQFSELEEQQREHLRQFVFQRLTGTEPPAVVGGQGRQELEPEKTTAALGRLLGRAAAREGKLRQRLQQLEARLGEAPVAAAGPAAAAEPAPVAKPDDRTDALRGKIERLEASREEVKAQRDRAAARAESAQEVQAELADDLRRAREEAEQLRRDWQERESKLRAEIERRRAAAAELNERLEAAGAADAEVRNRLEELERGSGEMEQRLETAGAAEAEVRHRLEELERGRAEMEQRLEESATVRVELERQLEEARQTAAERERQLEEARQTAAERERQSESQMSELQDELERRGSGEAEALERLEEAAAVEAGLRERLAEAEHGRDEQQASLRAAEATESGLRQRIDGLEGALRDLEEHRDELLRKLMAAVDEREKLRAQSEALRTVGELSGARRKLGEELGRLSAAWSALEDGLRAAEESLDGGGEPAPELASEPEPEPEPEPAPGPTAVAGPAPASEPAADLPADPPGPAAEVEERTVPLAAAAPPEPAPSAPLDEVGQEPAVPLAVAPSPEPAPPSEEEPPPPPAATGIAGFARRAVARLTGRRPAAANEPEAEPAAEAAPGRESETGVDSSEVEETVRAWAAAWSEQRVDDYLSFYSREFTPQAGRGNGGSGDERPAWFPPLNGMELAVGPISQIELAPGRVGVRFEQSVETDSCTRRVGRTLELIREADGWKIAAESFQDSRDPELGAEAG